jgi:hypothetical protein
METTNTAANAMPAGGPILLGEGTRKGYRYQLHMITQKNFRYQVLGDLARGEPEVVSECDGRASRGRAEGAAEEEIDRLVREDQEATAATLAKVPVVADEAMWCGWRIVVSDDRGGTYKAEVFDDTGVAIADPEFKGYRSKDLALADAQRWCEGNRAQVRYIDEVGASVECDDSLPSEAADETPFDELDVHPGAGRLLASAPIVTSLPVGAPPVRFGVVTDSSPSAPDRAELSISTDHARAFGLAQQRDAAKRALARKVDQKNALAAEIKAAKLGLEQMDADITDLLLGRALSVQVPLPIAETDPPFGTTPAAGDAAQAAADKLKPSIFERTINAVEWTFRVVELDLGRWCARVEGTRGGDSEGFGETYDEAVATCESRLTIFLADCDPGTTTPSTDAGPGPRKAKSKVKLAGKTATVVESILRKSLSLGDAATDIGCSVDALKDWAGATGADLDLLLGKDSEPAKPRRGRKGKK